MFRLGAVALAIACREESPPETTGEPPVIHSVRVDGGASGLRELRCAAEVTGATSLAYTWTEGGALSGQTGELVPVDHVAHGSIWTCSVSAENAWGADSAEAAPFLVPSPPGGNLLVILLDDVGTDKVGLYGMGVPTPPTPTLDALAAGGIQFQNVYVTPACATSRSLLLSGRYGRRTGLLQSISDGQEPFALDPREVLLPEMLGDNRDGFSYQSFALGKWHLMSVSEFEPGSVEAEGFDAFQGTKSNLAPTWDYFSWQQVWNDQTTSMREGYATSAVVDDALAAIEFLPEPWLGWVAMHAAHAPLHVAPDTLQDRGVTEASSEADLYDAMLQAADTELGRLFAEMDPDVLARTTVVVLGDNGTPDFAVVPPLDPERAKLTLFEGGVRVPMIVSGPLVSNPGRVSTAFVNGADLFATAADIVGVPLAGAGDALSVVRPDGSRFPIDGVSFLPILSDPTASGERAYLFSEQSKLNGPPPWDELETTVRDENWKIIQGNRGLSFYALDAGLDEGPNLLLEADTLGPEEQEALERLKTELARIQANAPYAW